MSNLQCFQIDFHAPPATVGADQGATAGPPAAARPVSILLIDAPRETPSELIEILEQAGYACISAGGLEEARRCVRIDRPTMVIADLNLSGASGVALCESLLREEELQAPVVYLSGTQIPHIIRRSHAGGCAYHLRKPFDPEVLLALARIVHAPV